MYVDEQKPARRGILNLTLIGIIVVLCAFLIIETLFIIGTGNIIPDFSKKPADKVAVIYVEGEMVTDRNPGPGYASSDTVMKELRDAQDDPRVKAIVLRVNSPGGSPVAAQEIYGQILKTKQVKPVVVSMGDMATSAAYYISAPCNKILAVPDTWTGSIGVIWTLRNRTAYYQQEGVEFYVAKSGGYKDIGADWRGLNDEEKAYVNDLVNETFQRFVDVVADARHLPRDEVLELSDGRVYTGVRAEELGLIDGIGDLYDAIDAAAQLAGIAGTPEVVHFDGSALYYPLLVSGHASATPAAGYYQPYYSPYGQLHA
ncbi:MAG: protease 4 [Methanocella sp. PtaU1.Bin125]|nr:MAG: protease 4 [Methanocella sp. PtaU1.Bin125]